MSAPKHTPGPWWASPPSTVVGIGIFQAGNLPAGIIANVPSGAANARLIAAAPELLEALRALITPGGGTLGTSDAHALAQQARAAIAKAGVKR